MISCALGPVGGEDYLHHAGGRHPMTNPTIPQRESQYPRSREQPKGRKSRPSDVRQDYWRENSTIGPQSCEPSCLGGTQRHLAGPRSGTRCTLKARSAFRTLSGRVVGPSRTTSPAAAEPESVLRHQPSPLENRLSAATTSRESTRSAVPNTVFRTRPRRLRGCGVKDPDRLDRSQDANSGAPVERRVRQDESILCCSAAWSGRHHWYGRSSQRHVLAGVSGRVEQIMPFGIVDAVLTEIGSAQVPIPKSTCCSRLARSSRPVTWGCGTNSPAGWLLCRWRPSPARG
ncbi:hypothetical protein ABH935_006390 [Catenulispora sp. GAS73]